MSMKHTRHIVLLTAMLGLVSACTTTTRTAPVVDRSPTPVPAEPVKPPVVSEQPKADSKGFYIVRKGDTLLHIALDFGQNYRDIVAWNKLADPNDIKVDQVLRVLPPEEGAAGVKTSPIAMPNNDAKPAPVKKPPPKKPDTIADARNDKAEGKDDKKDDKKEDKAPVAVAAATPAPATAAATPAPTGIVPGATVTATDDDRLSWMWPADGKILATFDEGKNKGVDIAGRAGQGVMAAGAGRVMYAGSGIRGYGNLVIVKHSNSLLSAYAHNRTILVKEGQSVAKGDKIAEMGDSDSDTVKLHFEIRQQGKPVDPSKFLPNR
jgi:lipoprotein NlpD